MSEIGYELTDHVARVTIDRPRVLNALSPAAEDELREIWARVESDRDVWVVVLTGAGERAFCVGADMSGQGTGETGIRYWARERPDGFGGLAIRRTLNVPVIAAVDGPAIRGRPGNVLPVGNAGAGGGARLGA